MESSYLRILNLCHHRWALPVIAEIYRQKGSKFITLTKRLGASPNAVKLTLAYLIEKGFVRRNTGYGHPLRPEYLLTDVGLSLAEPADALVKLLREKGFFEVGLMKWSLLVLFAISQGADRFGLIQKRLQKITNRALAQSLKELESAGLVEREIVEAYPPTSCYRLTSDSRAIVPLLGRI